MDVPRYLPIEDTIDCNTHQSVTERYYTPRFSLDVGKKEGEDHCVLIHSNKICLISLAYFHPVLKEKKEIKAIDFQISTRVDRSSNKASGKKKRGAQCLEPESALCFIECTDGSKYTIQTCITGKLVEINDALIKSPQLLVEKPYSEGYIAIVLPILRTVEMQKSSLLTLEQYHEIRGKPQNLSYDMWNIVPPIM